MRTTKREYLLTYTLYDRSRIETHLRQMAEKGWLLESVGSGGWRYRRIEPRSLRFSVVYFPKTSRFAPIPSEELETFRDYCASAGWTFAADSAQMQVFYTEDENAVPIETDPTTELSNIRRSIRRTMLPLYVLVALEVLLHGGTYLRQLQNDAVGLLSSNLNLVNAAAMLPLLVIAAAGAVRFGLWLRRAGRAAEASLPLPPLGSSRALHLLIWVLVGVQLLATLWASGSSAWMLALFLVMFLAIALMGALAAVASNAMRHLRFPAWVNCLVTLGIIVALTFALMAGFVAWVLRDPGSFTGRVPAETYEYGGDTWEVCHDPIPLRIEDLAEVDYDAWSTEAQVDSSLLLTHGEYAQRARLGEAKDLPDLDYEVVTVKAGFLYDLCKNDFLSWVERDNDRLPQEYWDEYRLIDAPAWGAEEVYQRYRSGEAVNQFLLCWPGRIAEVRLDGSWSITEEMAAAVSEKLRNA